MPKYHQRIYEYASFFVGTVILVILGGAVPLANAEPVNKQPTICEKQGLDC
jgi:hypothetical protein